MSKILQFKSLQEFPGLVYGVSTSEFGNLSYKWAEVNGQTALAVRQKRQVFFEQLQVKEESVVATQVEGGVVIHDVTASDRGKGVTDPDTGLIGDGFFTVEPDTYLFVITGDCLVLFLYEPVKQVCGLVHAGWRGVDQELPRLAVEYMVKTFQCNPNNIRIGISPGIQRESSRFTHFKDFDQGKLVTWQPYIEKVKNGYLVDWIRYAKDQLMAAGVNFNNIEDCQLDTRTNAEYYSHRRAVEDKVPEARFGCLIGLQK